MRNENEKKRINQFKSRGAMMSTSDRRRQKFLERQKKSRRDLRHHVRMIAYNEKKKDDSKTSNREEHIKRDIETRTRNAKRLMTHEWVVDVPCDLGGSNWYVIPRPEGQRCLVVAANGKTISRLRNGSVLHRFQSALPNGSTDTRQSRDVFCILDCIFHKPAKTYFVLDMMCWKGHLLYNCASEFRLFWLHTKLREETNAHTVSRNNNFAFRAVPVVDCDIKGLRAAYSADVPFRRDGVLFVHKQGHYVLGSSPLNIVWKDASCSPYFIDTKADGTPKSYQTINVRARNDLCLVTEDNIEIGKLDAKFAQMHEIKPNQILRFRISGMCKLSESSSCNPTGLHFLSKCGPSKVIADTWSKIMFQFLARTRPVSIDAIASVVQRNTFTTTTTTTTTTTATASNTTTIKTMNTTAH